MANRGAGLIWLLAGVVLLLAVPSAEADVSSGPLPGLSIRLAAPRPTANPTPTPTVAPTATAGPTATSTSTPTATATSTGGTIAIAPDNTSSALPGAIVSYTHTVTNLGKSFDWVNVTAGSSQGWTVGLFEADGSTPLADHNGDGMPDTGRLNSGQSVTIVVKVTVPAGGQAGVQDVTTVTASSGRNPAPGNSDSVKDTTTVAGVIRLSLSTTNIGFGNVAPSGEVDPAASGVTSAVDDQGAYYVKQGALQVTVSSNGPWRGSWQAGENSGTSPTLRISDGHLEWQPAGSGQWTAFSTSAQSWPFANPAPGDASYSFDYRLRVLWTDDPGSFDAPITVSVSQ